MSATSVPSALILGDPLQQYWQHLQARHLSPPAAPVPLQTSPFRVVPVLASYEVPAMRAYAALAPLKPQGDATAGRRLSVYA